MVNAVIVKNGKVINRTVCPSAAFADDQGWVVTDFGKIGDLYDGSVFTTPEPNLTPEDRLAAAKRVQVEADSSPLTVTIDATEYTFDLDAAAKENIEGGINEFQSVRAEFVAAGYAGPANAIPWVTVDNQTVDVTIADLQKIRKEYAKRKARNHIAYQAAKVAL